MAIRCNNTSVPISIFFKIGRTEHRVINFSPELNGTSGKIVILEECGFSVKVLLDDDAGGYEGTYLEIELQDSREFISIRAGETVNVFSHDGAFPFRLGYTSLRLSTGGRYYNNVIKVCPIHLNETQVRLLHDYLEENYRGIGYDLLQRKRGFSSPKAKLNKWYHDYARFHVEYENEIIALLASVKSDKLYSLEKIYVNRPYGRRTDAKGIRMSIMKPFCKGNDISHFNKENKLLVDHSLCVALKYILTDWISTIYTARTIINEEVINILKEIEGLNADSRWAQSKLEGLSFNVSKIYSNYLRLKIELNGKKINGLKEHNALYSSWYKPLGIVENHIRMLLSESEFDLIRFVPRKVYVKFDDRLLRRLQQIYESSKRDSSIDGENRKISSVNKPTWQMYEYFVAFKVVEVITQLGFVLLDDFTDDFEKSIYQGIPNGQGFVLTNSSYIVKVVYNEELPRNKSDAESFGKYFYTMNRNAPDVRVEIYKLSEETEIFLGMLIVEVKHKSFSVLYSHNQNTKDMEQLDLYHTIKYRNFKSRDRSTIQAVDKVMCIYSGDSSRIKNYEDTVTYIRFFPEIYDNGEIAIKGENELVQELSDWIESKMDLHNSM